MRGTTKWFNAQKGYGFIVGDDGAEYFAHQTQIRMDGFRTLDAGDIVEFDVRSEEKGIAAVNIVPVFTLSMMKKKATKEHLHLEVAPADGSGNTNWMIVDGDNFIVAGEQGMGKIYLIAEATYGEEVTTSDELCFIEDADGKRILDDIFQITSFDDFMSSPNKEEFIQAVFPMIENYFSEDGTFILQ